MVKNGKVPISQYCNVIKGLSYKGEYINKEGPALLGIGTIKQGGGFRYENVRTYGGPYKSEHILNPGDIYVALTSQDSLLIGSTAKVPKDFIGFGITTHHDAKINWKTDDQMMKDYLFWVMHTREFILHCIYHSVGTTVYSTNPSDVERFEVPEVLTPEKIAITKTLNHYSELEIEINARISKAKSMNESLFRSLFIDFSNTENISNKSSEYMVDSVLGPIPNGWFIQYLGDLCDVKRGFSYSASMLTDCEKSTAMINLASFYGGGGYKKTGLKRVSIEPEKKFLIEHGDVLLATVDLTPDLRVVGSPLIAPSNLDGKAIFSQDLLRLREKDNVNLGRGYLFHWLKLRRGILKKWSNGTTVSRFPPNALNYLPVLIPPKNVIKEFEKVFEKNYQFIEKLESIKSIIEISKNVLLSKILADD